MRWIPRAFCVLLPAFALVGCEDIDFGNSERYKEDFHYSFTLPAGGRLNVENQNGSIEISTWEKDAVEINGTKYANTQNLLKDIKIDANQTGNTVQVKTISPYGWRGNYGARYMIRVPKRVELDRIASSNGGIRVDDVEGTARLHTSNGSIHALRLKGPLDARTSNGSVDVEEHQGGAVLHTSNGRITGDVTKGDLEATTSNGGIRMRLREPDPEHPVRLESSNGSIDLTLDAVRDIRASTSNSSITVRIPPAANARVRARTSNSSISSDFDVSVKGGMLSKHSLEGTLGSGGPMIDLSTTNGSIKLLKL